MTLEEFKRFERDLGSLTEPCPLCGKQTKLRNFSWVASIGKVVCLRCERSIATSTPAPEPGGAVAETGTGEPT